MTTLDERHGEDAREAAGAYRPDAAVPLDQLTAIQPLFAGSKAANLARAARAGLPVLSGFVIPEGAGDDPAALRRAWRDLSDSGARPLVVRSSSPQEDTEQSSLAGQFASVLDVRGWSDFCTAVRTVLDSAHRPDGSSAPMAVLVQPMLTARVGGVMFGADPVEGRADRMLVSAVRGGPDSLVSGEQAGTNYWLSRRGRLLRTEPPTADSLLTPSELRRLARLARRARQVFGGPQDIEFGFARDEVRAEVGGGHHNTVGGERLWLFQSRPITAMAARPTRGARLLGPGPVAETLPSQLQPLEEDLWVTPMARGLTAALDIAGSAPRRLLRTVPVVTTVGGWAAADLRLLGAAPPRRRWLALLNPAPGARRLGAAWRVGRLTAALPGLAADLVADIDRRLAQVPAPGELPGPDLAAQLRWTRGALVSLHAQEALAGALLHEPPRSRTAAGAALTALAETRSLDIPDEQAATVAPTVLALTAPNLRGRGRLPQGVHADSVPGSAFTSAPDTNDPSPSPSISPSPSPSPTPTSHHSPTPLTAARTPALPPRESLRLRIRWVQELQVRLVREAAHRLGLATADRVGLLRWPELAAVLDGEPLPGDLHARVPQAESPPLPDAFRLTAEGTVVAERTGTDGKGDDGRGVSGGRAVGTVWDGTGPRPSDAVLVVRTLDPALAPLLPELTALVAQTGSPLSHLALLAREFGLPTVVGATDAVQRFPPGSRVAVDGTTGEVRTGEVRTGDERTGDGR
ncbi:PEP/pyruvate-binding domain-containing protein [Streptomyces sp. NBC_00343]|uniref:PEP/pyruvate-binding domain-containing protein n=1 Tax=Streptomyces sp. NBC_00343 TaxID=2975719 RepID=UPI002E28FC1B|nr:PEP/pyruvate-binding domain-containing protein [Streptomyces sp. NBC_00343]